MRYETAANILTLPRHIEETKYLYELMVGNTYPVTQCPVMILTVINW
jgi:hypothetical protein